MDIISHGLWSVAGGKFAEKKIGRRLSGRLLLFWGMFPDLFAFTVPVIWMAVEFISGNASFSNWPRASESEPPEFARNLKIFQLASSLYNVSHSLVIFLGAFFLAYWILKRLPWEMFGWLLHIFIDIPTHPFNHFPTPIFWPISGWKFSHGFSWGEPWFMALDIAALLIVYAILWKKKKFRKVNLNEEI